MKTKENDTEKPMLAVLRDLEVGEHHSYPLERMSSLKTMCTNFGAQWDKTFSSKTDREARTITVTRTA